MYIRRAFTVFLEVQSEAAPCAAAPADWTLDWRLSEEEAAIMPSPAIGQPMIRCSTPNKPSSGRSRRCSSASSSRSSRRTLDGLSASAPHRLTP
jgi:hypothetical protein